MKYAREFKEHLLNEGFPSHWVDSAISYGQLKKCIKRVQKELAALGLSADTLQSLLQKVEDQAADAAKLEQQNGGTMNAEAVSPPPAAEVDRPFEYKFSDKSSNAEPLRPKLLFVVDAETGEPLDATLAPETRNYLHQLAITERLTGVRITEEGSDEPELLQSGVAGIEDDDAHSLERSSSRDSGSSEDKIDTTTAPSRPKKYVEVPLLSDSEFFGMLEREVSGLAALQEEEQKKLTAEIENLGKTVSSVTRPRDSKSRTDLSRWRSIFELYLEANIFFATNEQDHGVHDRAKAQEQWQFFLSELEKAGLGQKFRRKENLKALEQFMAINVELLQSLRFQELNQTAMNKILKKFDKRTALGAKSSFPSILPNALVTTDFSRALAASVSTNILSVVPQLDDYLCPICFQIAYRPIRLRCQHVFCIRCLIIMQRTRKNNCALCREPTVLEADNTNLDVALQTFMKKYFREESKSKQKANEKAAFEEEFPGMTQSDCCIM